MSSWLDGLSGSLYEGVAPMEDPAPDLEAAPRTGHIKTCYLCDASPQHVKCENRVYGHGANKCVISICENCEWLLL